MKNKNLIFILYGASGAGKSSILNFIKKIKGCSIYQKDTTRPNRKKENKKGVLELRFIKKLIPEKYALIYKQYGYEYGVRKDLLEKSIKNNDFHFIIINDVKAIKQFKKKFTNTVNIYIHCDPNIIPERIKARDGLMDEKRRRRIRFQYLDFIKNNLLFDHTVVNLWEIKHAEEQILSIINSYKKSTK